MTGMVSMLKKHLNVDEILFDFAIFIIFLTFSYLTPEGKTFIDTLNPVILFVLLISTVLLSPLYLSSINTKFFQIKERNRFFKLLYLITSTCTIFTSLFIVYAMPWHLAQYYDTVFFFGFFFFNMFFGIIAIIMGWHTGRQYQLNSDDTSKISSGLFTYFAPMIIIFPIGGFIYLTLVSENTWLVIGATFIIIWLAGALFQTGRQKFGSVFNINTVSRYLFPFTISFMLAFSFEIIHEIFIAQGNSSSPGITLKALTVSGILPVRFILLISPPFRIINFLIGFALFTLFFIDLYWL